MTLFIGVKSPQLPIYKVIYCGHNSIYPLEPPSPGPRMKDYSIYVRESPTYTLICDCYWLAKLEAQILTDSNSVM